MVVVDVCIYVCTWWLETPVVATLLGGISRVGYLLVVACFLA